MMYKLFPTIVIKQKLRLPLKDLIDYAYQLQRTTPGVQKTNKIGWQSPHIHIPLLEQHLPLDIPNINKPLTHHKQWINISPTKAFNTYHTHTNSDYSFVLYLTPTRTPITFVHPHLHLGAYNHINTFSPSPQQTFDIYPEPNDVIIFPSYLPHQVGENTSPHDRISISWNASL